MDAGLVLVERKAGGDSEYVCGEYLRLYARRRQEID